MSEQNVRSDRFDRAIGALIGIPDVLHTKPTTVRATTPLVGQAQTFIVQTFRHEGGDTLFVEYVDDAGTVRLVIPPQVAKVVASQRAALTKRSRRRAAKERAEADRAAGVVPGFLRARRSA